jgi:hypothetical protein
MEAVKKDFKQPMHLIMPPHHSYVNGVKPAAWNIDFANKLV